MRWSNYIDFHLNSFHPDSLWASNQPKDSKQAEIISNQSHTKIEIVTLAHHQSTHF